MVFSKKGYTIELHTASAVQSQPGVGHLVNDLARHVAAKGNVQLHQVLVNRLRLLPLFEYYYSHFVPQPWNSCYLFPKEKNSSVNIILQFKSRVQCFHLPLLIPNCNIGN